MVDEGSLWYVFEPRPESHVVGYLKPDLSNCQTFPKVLIIDVLTFAGMQERSVIVNIPQRHDTTLVISDATLFGWVSNLVPYFEMD